MNSSHSKEVLDSENTKSLPTRSSIPGGCVLNYRRRSTELISPNTVSSPSTDHCKAIIKAIFKVITKGPVIFYRHGFEGGAWQICGNQCVLHFSAKNAISYPLSCKFCFYVLFFKNAFLSWNAMHIDLNILA